MLLKWIQCDVPDGTRAAFDAAQRHWHALAPLPGFVAQVGGWDRREPGVACILGLWESVETYNAFMRDHHDAIAAAAGQAETYRSLNVAHFEAELTMRGTSVDLAAALPSAGLVRVADCRVHAARTDHFRTAQQDVWAPAMARAGMAAGEFARSREESSRFLVVTAWPDVALHEEYVRGPLPSLRAAAAADRDLRALRGRQIVPEPSWTVR